MFCFKCGTKLSEDAVFCYNCGYKITMKSESDVNSELENESQLINSFQQVSSKQNGLLDSDNKLSSETDERVSKNIDLFNQLKDNSKSCARIKDVILKEQTGTGLTPVIKSRFFNYKCCYNPISKDIVFFNSPTWLNYIISILCVICDGVFLTFLFEEEYFLPLSAILILECIFWLIVLIWSFKEQKEVISYINQSLGLNLKISKVPTIISAILNAILILAGVVTLWLSIENIISFNSYNEEGYGYEESLYDENNEEYNYYDIDDLSLTYENSEYGFSFKYPDNWNIEYFPETIVYLHPDDGMWYYSAMSVSSGYATEYDFETLFSASEEYFKEEYLYSGIENVEILNLQNIVLDEIPARKIKVNYINSNGEDIIETLYLYYANSQIYTVTFVSLEMFIDDYEPIFDAIIDSYAIH